MLYNLFAKISVMFSFLGSNQGSTSNGFLLEKLSFGETLGLFFKSFFKTLFENFLIVIWRLVIAIGKLMLNIIDFFAIILKELAGQNGVEEITNLTKLSETDMVFKFIFDNDVWKVFISFVGIAILLLIVFAIVAILKTEYESFLGGKDDNSKAQVVKHSLAGLFMIFIVPFIAFGGIVLSNSVLASLNRALSKSSGTFNLGSEIFIASSYEANAYRKYANEDMRIPIIFNYDTVSADLLPLPPVGGTADSMTEAMNAYLNKSVWERGFATWWMFYTESFYNFEQVKTAEVVDDNLESSAVDYVTWEKMYDTGMQINRAEYYALADLVDYLLRTGKTLAVVSANELAKQNGVTIVEGSGLTDQDIEYGIFNGTDQRFFADKIDNKTVYYFDIEYVEDEAFGVGSVGDNGTVRYYFTPTDDEATGGKFLMCSVEEKEVEGVKSTYFVPLQNSITKQNTNSNVFYSNILDKSQYVLARGAFSVDGYPTAIRKVNGNIQYYRDAVSAPSLVDFLPVITYENVDDKSNVISGSFKWLLEDVTGLDLNDFLPNIYMRDSAWTFFTKYQTVEGTLDGGMLYVNYNFNGGLEVGNLFSVLDINLLILIFCSIILFSVLLKAIFGLIGRTFDLVLLFITFPVFASTMPIDEGARFKKWTGNFVSKLFSAYGIIISFNLVFLLLPVINKMEFFSIEYVARNINTFGLLSAGHMTVLLNFFVQILFTLVLFTFLKSGSKLIADLIKVADVGSSGVMGDAKGVFKKTAELVSGKWAINSAKKLAGDVKGFVPGGAVVGKAVGASKKFSKVHKAKQAIKTTKGALMAGDANALKKINEKADNDKAKAAKDGGKKK